MTRLFNLDNETGDFSQYDAVVSSGANVLSVVSPGLIDTSYTLEFEMNDTSYMYCDKDFVLTTDEFYLRFYVLPSSVAMASGDRFDIVRVVHSSGPPWYEATALLSYDGTSFEIRALFYDDSGTYHGTAYHDISDELHYIEMHVERASSDVAGDGQGHLFLDGELLETESGIDNFDNFPTVETLRLCAIGIDSGTTGEWFMDECVLDDSDQIGPLLPPPETGPPPFKPGRQKARLDLLESLAYGLLQKDVSLSAMSRWLAYFAVDYLNQRWLWTWEGAPVADEQWEEIEQHLDLALNEIMAGV